MTAITEKEARFAIENNDTSNLDVYHVYVYSVIFDVRRVAMAKGLNHDQVMHALNTLENQLYYASDDDLEGGVYEKVHEVRYVNFACDPENNEFLYYVAKDDNNNLKLEEI